MAFHSGNTVIKQGRGGWTYHLGKKRSANWEGLETGKELLKSGRFTTQVREGGIGTFDICTSKWSIVGSEPSVEKKRGRAGWLNTLQVLSRGFMFSQNTYHLGQT